MESELEFELTRKYPLITLQTPSYRDLGIANDPEILGKTPYLGFNNNQI
jgi:hypothetical protein